MRNLWVFLAIFVVGCAEHLPVTDRFQDQSEKRLLDKAQSTFASENYKDAADAFEALTTHFPSSRWAKQGLLNSIYARFMLGEAAMVETLSDQYLHRYLRDAGTSYALYMRALSPLLKHSSVLQKMVSYDPSNRALDLMTESFKRLRVVVQIYPDSIYAAHAVHLMRHLKHLTAQHELGIAQYYLDRGAYEAAVNRGMNSLAISLERSTAIPALKVMQRSYEHLGLQQQVLRIEDVLKKQN